MKNLSKNTQDRFTKLLLIIYFILLVWILLFKLGVQFSYMANRQVNLIPFVDVFTPGNEVDINEIFLNIIIFLPLGIYTAALFRRWRFGNKLLFFISTSLLFETVQYIFRIGAFDVTDIITNATGGLIGLLLFKLIKKLFNDSSKAQKFINIIAATGTALITVLLVLLKMDMLPIRYR